LREQHPLVFRASRVLVFASAPEVEKAARFELDIASSRPLPSSWTCGTSGIEIKSWTNTLF
jgi:hypothetical protein